MKPNILILTIFILCSSLTLISAASKSSDPYADIRYSAAFNQKELYKKYAHLLEQLGCAYNVLSDYKQQAVQEDASYQALQSQDFIEFQNDCLNLLYHAQR